LAEKKNCLLEEGKVADAVLKLHLWKIKHGDSSHERKGVVLNFQTLGLNAKAM